MHKPRCIWWLLLGYAELRTAGSQLAIGLLQTVHLESRGEDCLWSRLSFKDACTVNMLKDDGNISRSSTVALEDRYKRFRVPKLCVLLLYHSALCGRAVVTWPSSHHPVEAAAEGTSTSFATLATGSIVNNKLSFSLGQESRSLCQHPWCHRRLP